MWDLRGRNRGVFVLISVLSGCAILYNAWGAILALTVSIILVIYVCYSLLTNDSILSPQALYIAEYVREGGQELGENISAAFNRLFSALRKLSLVLTSRYRTYVAEKMSRFRHNTYQLSNDARQNSRTSSWSDLTTNQLSPIPKKNIQENMPHPVARRFDENYSASKMTSTPLVSWHKDSNIPSNGGIGLFTPTRPLRQETQHTYSPNYNSTREKETVFSPGGSPWGTSISPKIRSKATGVKTVQTVAGPLLASTRYNIDPKVYSDVTSPGLSTRLAKYATEANSKLTHQSQYSTGQFPKVNLSVSPLPLVSPKNSKIRNPVTVRIAPPEASRYSPPERQKLISEMCRAENRASPSVAQVLREISLKRHASREDVSSDLVKKQRTEDLYDEKLDDLGEITQKRGREDSPNSEEEIVSKSSQSRPVKKTKTPSCFDVLNSLSSSDQYSSGIKRKASTLDLSRSGTPDIDKHFKASDTAPAMPKVSVKANQPRAEKKGQPKNDLSDTNSPSVNVEMCEKLQKQTTTRVKGILKGITSRDAAADQTVNQTIERHVRVEERKETQEKNSPLTTNKPINFTEKLFMKAEPETNERLRTLIEEQGNIRAKFTTDDVDEIKKEDIVNMRQTSMKARLQSMFDAIAGKSKKINPDVIIHAEAASEPDAIPGTQVNQTTLSSTTLTTSVNTSPITTSGVAPANSNPKPKKPTPTKHVTFKLPSTQSSLNSYSDSTTLASPTGYVPNLDETPNLDKMSTTLFGSSAATIAPLTAANTTSSSMIPPNTNATSAAPPPFSVATPSIQNSTLSSGTSNLNAISTLNSAATTSSTPPAFTASNSSTVAQNTNITPASKPLVTFGAPNIPTPGSGSFSSEPSKPTSAPMPSFSFGVPKMSSTSSFGTNAQPPVANLQSQSAMTNGGAPTTATSSTAAPSNATQTQQFSTSSGTTVPATVTPGFTFGGGSAVSQPTSTGSFSFTTNTIASISQAPPAFGSATTSTFGNTAAPASAATITQTQNPPMFGNANGFQSTQVPATTVTQNASSFGGNPPSFQTAVTTSAQKTPSFGTTASSNAQPFFGANAATTGTTFAFGNTPTQTTTAPAFGATVNSTAAATNPTFSFGSSSAPNTKPSFSFTANAPATTSTSGIGTGTGTSGQNPAFGNATGNAVPVFGAPSTTAPPAFGVSTSTTAPVFGTSTTTTPVFGAPSSTAPSGLFGAPVPATGSGMFNSTTNQSTFGSAASSAAPSGFGTPKTTAPPAFGAQTSEPAFSYGGASTVRNVLFSNASTNAPTNTAAPSGTLPASTSSTTTFGGNAAPKNLFGQMKPPPSFAASTSSGFGSTATPAFGTPNPSFGSAGTSAAPGNSGFGTANTATTPVFGAQKQTAQAPPPAFGSTNSAFGTNAATPSGFGSSAPTFGSQNTTTPNFGTAGGPSNAGFGTSASTPFGGQSQGSAPAFGTQNSTTPSFAATNNNPAPNFGFSGNQGQIQQTPSFSFTGNAAANNATTTTSPFQFGGAPAKSEGFNFSAATTTPNLNFGSTASPSFGTPTQGTNMFGTASPAAPSGGMFSIGAGSTAPRSRSTRGARRQR